MQNLIEPILGYGQWLSELLSFLPPFPYKSWVLLAASVSFVGGIAGSLYVVVTSSGPPDPGERMKRAEELARKQQYGAAKELFLAVHSFSRAAEMAVKLEETDEAISISLEGKDYHLAARLLSTQGRWAEAAQSFDHAGRFQEAGEHWERAGKLETAAERYKTTGSLHRLERVLARLGRFMELGEIYGGQFSKINSMLGANPSPKKLEEIRGLADKAADAYSQAKAFLKASEIYLQSGQTVKAAKSMEQAGDLQRASDLYHQGGQPEDTARLLIRAGKFEMAADIYDEIGKAQEIPKLLELAGKPKEAQSFAARLALEKGDQLEAAELYAIAGDLQEAGPIFEELKEWAKAAPLYEKAGNAARAAKCYEEAGLNEQAFIQYEKADLFFDAGRMAEITGKLDKAIALFQRVSREDSSFDKAQHAVGRILGRKGNYKLALSKFESLLKDIEPDRERLSAFYDYALALEGSGGLEKANELYEKILTIDFHHQDVLARKHNLEKQIQYLKRAPPAAFVSEPQASQSGTTTMADTISGASVQKGPFLPQIGSVFAERYELKKQIGSGAMGVVFAGTDRKLGRPVAIKFPPPYQYERGDDEKRFMREGQVAARLSHAHIVQMFDIGKYLGTLFLVMELIEGANLRQILDRGQPFSIPLAIKLARQISDALAYAHDQNVVHRDIKSANLLLTKDEQLKIADFGLAKILESGNLSSTRTLGSPLYMAPEQIQGDTFDHRVDLYAMGIVLYELLTGKPPFTEGEIAYHHLHTAPKPLQEVRPEVPDELHDLIMRLLAKDPKQRYGSSAEVQVILELLSA